MIINAKWRDINVTYNKTTQELTILENKLNAENQKKVSKYIDEEKQILKKEIKTITFKKTPVILPKQSSHLFDGFENLKSLDFTVFDFSEVKFIHSFIRNCYKLKSIHIKNINNQKITYITQFIDNLPNTHQITIENINLTNLKKVKNLYKGLNTIPEMRNIKAQSIEKINGLYYQIKAPKTTYKANGSILNQNTLKEIQLLNQCEIENINTSAIKENRITNYIISNQSIIYNTLTLSESAKNTSAPLCVFSNINQLNIKGKPILSSNKPVFEKLPPYFLNHCNYNTPINLNTFKTISLNHLKLFFKSRYSLSKEEYITAGRYKTFILNHLDELLTTIIYNKIYIKDISLNELRSQLIKEIMKSNDKTHHAIIYNYVLFHFNEEDKANLLKDLQILLKIK